MKNPNWYYRYDAQRETLLAQGIILQNFTYINPKNIKNVIDPSQPRQLPVLEADVIILTQSCEFQKQSLMHVHLCPVITFSEYVRRNRHLITENYTEQDLFNELSRNQRNSYFLLNKCDLSSFAKFNDEFLVVCLDLAFVVSPRYIKDYMQKYGKRYYLSLNPPYREAMAQSYGRYFMRVGNPVNYEDL